MSHRGHRDDHGGVEDDTVEIHLELSLAGESLTGRAGDGRGTVRHFDGRLGLLAAIDALIAESAAGSATAQEDST